jgi:hypothetical protein
MEDNTMLPKVMTIMPPRQTVEFFFFCERQTFEFIAACSDASRSFLLHRETICV